MDASPEAQLSLEQIVTSEERRRRRRLLGWLLGLSLLLAAGLTTWQLTRPGPAQLRARFDFATLERGTIAREVVATGRVEARGAVDVGAEISGRVISVEVEHGARVEAGQVLVRFDAESLDAQIAQAKAAVASAKAALAQAKVSLAAAIRLDPEYKQAYRYAAQLYERLGEPEKARKFRARYQALKLRG